MGKLGLACTRSPNCDACLSDLETRLSVAVKQVIVLTCLQSAGSAETYRPSSQLTMA
jgi:hypothetical protein